MKICTEFERDNILTEAHGGATGGHYVGKETTQNMLCSSLWWPTLHKDSKSYCKAYDACQKTGRSSRRDELPLDPQVSLSVFEKWGIDFVGQIQPPWKENVCVLHYHCNGVSNLMAEAQPIKDCIEARTTKFLFEYVLTRFGCPKVLMSERGTHFLNETITTLTEEFHYYHQKSTPYHSQANEIVEIFNKILENTLTKICNAQQNDWDVCVPVVLWDYRTTSKNLIG